MNERMHSIEIFGMLISFVGVIIITQGDSSGAEEDDATEDGLSTDVKTRLLGIVLSLVAAWF